MASITTNNQGDGSFANPFKQIPKIHDRVPYAYYLTKKGKIRVWNTKFSRFMNDTKIFIKRAREIHGDKYDYSLVEYVDAKTKVIIICPIHGEFLQNPANHINGNNCKPCGRKKANENHKSTTEDFIQKAKEIHGDKYDYSLVEYVDAKTKVIIICPIHGEFLQTPDNHLSGYECRPCGRKKGCEKHRISREEYIERAREIHRDKYDYSLVNLKDGLKGKIIIICPLHGKFRQNAFSHLSGCGCPNCFNKTESKLNIWLNIYFPNLINPQFSPEWIGRYRYDFVIKDIKLIIEIDGIQHFKFNWFHHRDDLNGHINQQENDIYKMKKANEKGYSVIRIIQTDIWEDKNNWQEHLIEAIKLYDTPTNIFICSNDEYETHKKLLNN